MREKEPRDLDQLELDELQSLEQELQQRIVHLDAVGNKGKEWNELNLQHEAVAEVMRRKSNDNKKSDDQEKLAA